MMDFASLLNVSSINTTKIIDTASALSCIPVCAQMGFEHIVVALWSLLGIIFTGVSTIAVAYFKWQNSLVQLKTKQHEEVMKVKRDSLEVQKSMSPHSTPPSTASETQYRRMFKLLAMFGPVGSSPHEREPDSQTS